MILDVKKKPYNVQTKNSTNSYRISPTALYMVGRQKDRQRLIVLHEF